MVILAVAVVLALLLWAAVGKMDKLRGERDEAVSKHAQLVEDLEANRAAVKALSSSYRDVYNEYSAGRLAIRKRDTSNFINAEPTQATQQIEKEINGIFEQIEGEM
jgi:outer membrane murein-binding lipoprotein Lpp